MMRVIGAMSKINWRTGYCTVINIPYEQGDVNVSRQDVLDAAPLPETQSRFDKWLDHLEQDIDEGRFRPAFHSLKDLRKDLKQTSERDNIALWDRISDLHEQLEIAMFREQDRGTPLEKYYK